MIDHEDKELLLRAAVMAGTLLSASMVIGIAVRLFLLAAGL